MLCADINSVLGGGSSGGQVGLVRLYFLDSGRATFAYSQNNYTNCINPHFIRSVFLGWGNGRFEDFYRLQTEIAKSRVPKPLKTLTFIIAKIRKNAQKRFIDFLRIFSLIMNNYVKTALQF